jgi:hypothetical protein
MTPQPVRPHPYTSGPQYGNTRPVGVRRSSPGSAVVLDLVVFFGLGMRIWRMPAHPPTAQEAHERRGPVNQAARLA